MGGGKNKQKREMNKKKAYIHTYTYGSVGMKPSTLNTNFKI